MNKKTETVFRECLFDVNYGFMFGPRADQEGCGLLSHTVAGHWGAGSCVALVFGAFVSPLPPLLALLAAQHCCCYIKQSLQMCNAGG